MNHPSAQTLDLTHCLLQAKQAALEAGALLMEMMPNVAVREKGNRDLVTDADIASQALIRGRLLNHFPSFHWIGEEDLTPHAQWSKEDTCWVVDPLDGTTNYAHGMLNFAVSIALVHQQQICVGVIYDPTTCELYEATLDGGSFLNGKRLQCSGETILERSLIAASLPPSVARNSDQVQQFLTVMERCQSLRRMGSAALNLCYVAAGRLDGYWTRSTKCWDVAAGALIATEAGARICGVDGGPFHAWDGSLIAAGSPELLDALALCLA